MLNGARSAVNSSFSIRRNRRFRRASSSRIILYRLNSSSATVAPLAPARSTSASCRFTIPASASLSRAVWSACSSTSSSERTSRKMQTRPYATPEDKEDAVSRTSAVTGTLQKDCARFPCEHRAPGLTAPSENSCCPSMVVKLSLTRLKKLGQSRDKDPVLQETTRRPCC